MFAVFLRGWNSCGDSNPKKESLMVDYFIYQSMNKIKIVEFDQFIYLGAAKLEIDKVQTYFSYVLDVRWKSSTYKNFVICK